MAMAPTTQKKASQTAQLVLELGVSLDMAPPVGE